MLIYLGAPIDLSSGDPGRDAVARFCHSRDCMIYDATTAFQATDLNAISAETAQKVAAVHHAALSYSDVAIFDLSQRSIGVPVEAWQAMSSVPVRLIYMGDSRPSLYVRAMATQIFTDWDDMVEVLRSLFADR